MPYALVTGASFGMARELASACARDGYDLILGVKVSCLCPGPTLSEFAERAEMTKTKLFQSEANIMSASAVAALGYRALKAGKPFASPAFKCPHAVPHAFCAP